jgi:hypothetical protein
MFHFLLFTLRVLGPGGSIDALITLALAFACVTFHAGPGEATMEALRPSWLGTHQQQIASSNKYVVAEQSSSSIVSSKNAFFAAGVS